MVTTAAAGKLTPVVLELACKSPTIVHSSADLRVAARASPRAAGITPAKPAPRRTTFGFKDIARPFLGHLKEAILHFYGDDPQKSPEYGRIVSECQFDLLSAPLARAGPSTTAVRH